MLPEFHGKNTNGRFLLNSPKVFDAYCAGLKARSNINKERNKTMDAVLQESPAERVEREKRIAEEATATAKAQAEHNARIEAIAKELHERKQKEAEAAKEQKRIANKKHRQKIEVEIESALKDLAFDPEDADRFILALKENAIPHVSINY